MRNTACQSTFRAAVAELARARAREAAINGAGTDCEDLVDQVVEATVETEDTLRTLVLGVQQRIGAGGLDRPLAVDLGNDGLVVVALVLHHEDDPTQVLVIEGRDVLRLDGSSNT